MKPELEHFIVATLRPIVADWFQKRFGDLVTRPVVLVNSPFASVLVWTQCRIEFGSLHGPDFVIQLMRLPLKVLLECEGKNTGLAEIIRAMARKRLREVRTAETDEVCRIAARCRYLSRAPGLLCAGFYHNKKDIAALWRQCIRYKAVREHVRLAARTDKWLR